MRVFEANRQKLGFTLTELLVVVLVVAVLAALFFPVLAGARERAQQTFCLSNLKQIGIAGLIYLEDRGGTFPYNMPGYPAYQPAVPVGWCDALTNYGVIPSLLLCPSTRLPGDLSVQAGGTANVAWIVQGYYNLAPVAGSYGQNGWLTDFITGEPMGFGGTQFGAPVYPQYLFHNIAAVPSPSRTPLFFDQNYAMTVPLEDDSPASDLYFGQAEPDNIARDGMACCTILRHGGRTAVSSVVLTPGQPLPSGGINMGLADGHVEFSTLTNLWNYTWHLNWNR